MRCRALSLLVLLALLANSTFAQTAPAGISWAGTVRDGLKQALINQKQILLYCYAPELPACAKCEAQVLSNAEVQQAITANFIPVKVNVREVPATAKFYQANDDTQLPRVLILSANDQVVAGFTANSSPTEFLAQLKTGVNTAPANFKLEQIGSLAKTASSYLAPTAEPTATANAKLAAVNNEAGKTASGVTPTAWETGATGTSSNGLLLPNFAPNNAGTTPTAATPATTAGPGLNAPSVTTPGATKASLLPAAVGPLARTSSEAINFGGVANPAPVTAPAATPAIPSLANYGLQGVTAPPVTATAAPGTYGMQNVVPNLAAAAQPYQQQAQQTMTQWHSNANQTLTNAQTQVNQSYANAQQQMASAQQNVQNQIGAAANKINAAAPAVGSFYDAGLSSRPSETKNAGLATVPGMGSGPAATSTSQPTQPQPSASVASPFLGSATNQFVEQKYGVNPAQAPASQPPAAASPPTNYALAPGASYGIPNNAPPTPALPGHPKEKAGLGNYSTEYLQGYLGNGAKPVLPSDQVNGTIPVYSKAPSSKPEVIGHIPAGNVTVANMPPAAQPAGNFAQAPATAPTTPEIALQGNCPVTIAEAGKWAKGDPQFGAVHRGKTYLFASAAEQQKFLAAPDKYCPVLGGNDPVVMYHEGRYIAGSAVYGAMYKKRMYLFSTPAAKAEFAQNPNKYEQAVAMAETQAGIIVR